MSIRELFYDPLVIAWDEGRNLGRPIGGHSDHVHVSFGDVDTAVAAISYAKKLGLRVSENPFVDRVDPVHTDTSYHYRNFDQKVDGRTVGQAIDVSGSPADMARYARWVQSTFIQGRPDLRVAPPGAQQPVSSAGGSRASTGMGCLVILAVQWSILGGAVYGGWVLLT